MQSMTLRGRMLILSAVMMAALIIVAAIAVFNAVSWKDAIVQVGSKETIQGIAAVNLDKERIAIRAQTFSVYAYENDMANSAKLLGVLEQRKKSWETFDKNMKDYESKITTDSGRKNFTEFETAYKKWRDEYVKIDAAVAKLAANQTDAVSYKATYADFIKAVKDTIPASDAMGKSLVSLVDYKLKKIDDVVHSSETSASFGLWLSLIISVAGLVVGAALAMFIISSITKQITQAVQTIHDGSMQISDAADQVASSSTSLAQGASEQASSVEEVSATLEEASAAVSSNTENARQADMLAKSANQAAKEGMVKGDSLVVSMKEVNDSAAKIAGIVKAIDQIAFQVNLLALNAAVEAARAGEHGLGFAVVADEVRNLAQRAANSAKETAVVIEEAVAQIKKGSEIANDASSSFRDIDERAKKVSNLIGEVALSSKEQADAVGQLNVAMSQIDQVTQQVAANSEEAAAAAEELSAQSQASLDAVAALAKVVGLELDSRQSGGFKSRPGIAKAVSKPKAVASAPKKIASAPQSHPKADEIFPLDEGDLKEF